MTQPTPEQLTRAAELAPRVLEAIGVDRVTRSNNHLSRLLDPRAFQTVLLALPHYLLAAAVGRCRPGDEALLLRQALTPAGMLTFYEALAAYENDCCENCGKAGAAYKPAVGIFCDRRCMVNYLRSK